MASHDPQPAGRVPAKSPNPKSERPRTRGQDRDDDVPARDSQASVCDPKTGRTIFTDWASL